MASSADAPANARLQIGPQRVPDPDPLRYEHGPGVRAYLVEAIEIDGQWTLLYATRDGTRGTSYAATADRVQGDHGLLHALAEP